MEYRVVVPIKRKPNCFLIVGGSSYDSSTPAIAFKWKDYKGHWSRPAGEMDADSFQQAIEVAVREGLISPLEALEAVVAALSKP